MKVMAVSHQCGRESTCTAFRLLQHNEKNSVSLKEVCIAHALGASRRTNVMQHRRIDAMKNYFAHFHLRFSDDLKSFDEIRSFCDTDIVSLTENAFKNHTAKARDFLLTTIAIFESASQKKFCTECPKRGLGRPESIKNERIGCK
jgi:hypothetical protein